MDVKAFWYVLLLHNDLGCRLHAALEPPLIYKAGGLGKICKVDLRLIWTEGVVQCCTVALKMICCAVEVTQFYLCFFFLSNI